jgi:hypothetical protein
MRRRGVTARLAIKIINDHEPVNRVMVSMGFTPKSPVYALSASCANGIRQVTKRAGLSQEIIGKSRKPKIGDQRSEVRIGPVE